MARIAEELEINRAIAYRIVATLENHGLVVRTDSGLIRLGATALMYSHRFQPQLRSVAKPLLEALANKTGATAFVSVAQGDDCYVIMVEECNTGILRVGYRVGSRHPLNKGAAGIAILSNRPQCDDEPEIVTQAREDGYCITKGHLQPGAVGVASPIKTQNNQTALECCVGVVAMDDLDTPSAIEGVRKTAQELAEQLGV
ncbi:helix-turn-helix domain-containing protein [Marinobacterium maritimum]|uniref:HTH-type transcriptional repressor AllR n=1 Tax=Marinobacterium maritimum TaxID=500162 RepID=A0ABN1I2E6_9GAMM